MPMRDQTKLWYTRHQGEQRGPFTTALVRANINRGRLCSHDRVSHDQQQWLAVADVPAFQEALFASVSHDDDRSGFDRRHLNTPQPPPPNQRQGERREPEPQAVIEHRQFRTRMLRGYQMRKEKAFWPLVSLFLVVLFILLLAVVYPTQLPLPQSQCEQPPSPKVNWTNCLMGARDLGAVDLSEALMRNSYLSGSNLSGAKLTDADLAFADLSSLKLSQANMRGADLQGADLRGADLRNADLSKVDLSFADLRDTRLDGAVFDGANLHRTLWSDGRECSPGSVGECR